MSLRTRRTRTKRLPEGQLIRIGNAYVRGRWQASFTVTKSRRRSKRHRSMIFGLPDLHGEFHGSASVASLKRLRQSGTKPCRVALFNGGQCLTGPAWVDVATASISRNGSVEVAASFVAAAAWGRAERHI
jgi:hypothetical protein